jgi:hypothetical protein
MLLYITSLLFKTKKSYNFRAGVSFIIKIIVNTKRRIEKLLQFRNFLKICLCCASSSEPDIASATVRQKLYGPLKLRLRNIATLNYGCRCRLRRLDAAKSADADLMAGPGSLRMLFDSSRLYNKSYSSTIKKIWIFPYIHNNIHSCVKSPSTLAFLFFMARFSPLSWACGLFFLTYFCSYFLTQYHNFSNNCTFFVFFVVELGYSAVIVWFGKYVLRWQYKYEIKRTNNYVVEQLHTI